MIFLKMNRRKKNKSFFSQVVTINWLLFILKIQENLIENNGVEWNVHTIYNGLSKLMENKIVIETAYLYFKKIYAKIPMNKIWISDISVVLFRFYVFAHCFLSMCVFKFPSEPLHLQLGHSISPIFLTSALEM